MPRIEEWVLVANPYVGYCSSILFLVFHNRAFFFFCIKPMKRNNRFQRHVFGIDIKHQIKLKFKLI